MNSPLISICIPTYERLNYLQRLFTSIEIQTFRDFEVIITDDSKTDVIEQFSNCFNGNFHLRYIRNSPSLGTSKNMVEGLKYARSNWIKMIHDDDFFSTEHSLQILADSINEKYHFIYSGYYEFREETGKISDKTISQTKFQSLIKKPSVLFGGNLIGPPSVMMVRKDITEFFDINLRWFTDMEYYFRTLNENDSIYINKPIVNVSINQSQITSYTRTNPEVVIWEMAYLFDKYGVKIADNLKAYDTWWRVIRNLKITSSDQVKVLSKSDHVHEVVKSIITHQKIVPKSLLNFGPTSKLLMSFSYLLP